MKSKKWITAVGAFALIATMTAPTFAAASTVKEGHFTLKKTSVVVNGKTTYMPYVFAAKDPNSGVMTTFIPIWYIMQVINHVGGDHAAWDGNFKTRGEGALTVTDNNGKVSLAIHGKKGLASIIVNGATVESGVPNFPVKDPNSGKLTSFFGLYYAEKLLDAMGFSNVWNGTSHVWTITPPSGNTTAGTQKATSSSDGNIQVVPPGTETSQPNTQPVTPPNWGA